MRKYFLVWLSGLVVLVGCQSRSADNASAIRPLLPLHAERGERAGIYDTLGRSVLLRGVNYTSLGDYYQARADLPPRVEPRAHDIPNMASLGMNVIRLVIHWSRLEPQRGTFNLEYVEEIRAQVKRAAEHGLYVVLDMHQDAWGKHIATREAGETCVAPLQPAIGWGGAPQWATITDGLSTCRVQLRELSPAVTQAFTNFWLDRDGIQSALVQTWARLAAEFAAEPAVAGYDLLNEPHPGFLLGVAELFSSGGFYSRAIQAIRAAEAGVAGGFAHIVFFEPTLDWSAVGATLPPLASFTDDSNIVFAPHLYADSIALAPLSIGQGFAAASLAADLLGTTFWSGEWGWFGDPKDNQAKVREYARYEDEYRVGGAWWVWRQACGDPHSLDESGGELPGDQLALWANGCPGDVDLGFVPEYAQVLSRAYPRAAPGQLTQLSADIDSGGVSLSGSTSAPGQLVLWLPERIGEAQIDGGSEPQLQAVTGGFVLSVTVAGDYNVVVTPATVTQ